LSIFNLEGGFHAGAAVFFHESGLIFTPYGLPFIVGGKSMFEFSDVSELVSFTGILFTDSRMSGDSLEKAMSGSEIIW
jgi:hypothetical protein